MRYKHYLKIIQDHVRMHIRTPVILYGMSRKSDTYKRLMRYVSSHRPCCEVDIYCREYEGCEIPSISFVPTVSDCHEPWWCDEKIL